MQSSTIVGSESDGSEWETQSEEDILVPGVLDRRSRPQRVGNLTIECPVVKEDVAKLTEIPVSQLAETPNMSWLKKVLTYKNDNKAYERIMVRYIS